MYPSSVRSGNEGLQYPPRLPPHRPEPTHRMYEHSEHLSHPRNQAAYSALYNQVQRAPYSPPRYVPSPTMTRLPMDQFDYPVPRGPPTAVTSRLSDMARIDTSMQYPAPLLSSQPASASSVDLSGDSDPWSPLRESASRQRKSRREKPHIELAPDQPPTTQGKSRLRVYVACLQCRQRKIRCDGAKPNCFNCSKRATESNECTYDALPKRRGPDKTPGARQRIVRQDGVTEAPRRRRRSAGTHTRSPADIGVRSHTAVSRRPVSFSPPPSSEHTHSSDDYLAGHEASVDHPYGRAGASNRPSSSDGANLDQLISGGEISILYDSSARDDDERATPSAIATTPSLDFTRKTWWDSLLTLYMSPHRGRADYLTSTQRDLASQRVVSDLRFLFRTCNYWFSFLHIPTFFTNLYDTRKRDNKLQPSFVLAALAMSTFWQSSELEAGRLGRDRALRFRDEAQSTLEASFNAGWVDEGLAQAAWLLAMFEICAHPDHSSERSASSMLMLDRIIHMMSLTILDLGDPHTSVFSPNSVPSVVRANEDPYSRALSRPVSTGCNCRSMTLKEQWPQAAEHTPLWIDTPAWNTSFSEAEITRESCRRLCWSAMTLAAGHSAYSSATSSHITNLFISDPANYALLFSGAAVTHSPDTIWALFDRCFLLWHACIKMRNDPSASMTDKGQFAINAWLEADSIEDALNRHTCLIERSFIFQGREYIFNTRMCITFEFQRFVPLVSANVNGLFHRHKAEEWLRHQATVARKFKDLHTVTGNSSNILTLRPFYVFWFMAQVSRALTFWQCDPEFVLALDVSKSLLSPIDFLTALWPCKGNNVYVLMAQDADSSLVDAAHIPSAPLPHSSTLDATVGPSTLKRRASASFNDTLDEVAARRKRMKEEHTPHDVEQISVPASSAKHLDCVLADELAQELQCGCCSELVYRPVTVLPCQHYFCGSCCSLWIQNQGTNCPTCRQPSTVVTPNRPVQSIVDVLLRVAPHKARTERERQQADAVYHGGNLTIPGPREQSPDPDVSTSDFARPCPNCAPGNPFGWRCPQPIPDPVADPAHAWPLEDGPPPGHAICGYCENLLAVDSPLTSRCDFCSVRYCGIGVQGRCIAAEVLRQQPHGLSDVGDLIQCSAVYESFHSNTVEVDLMLDHITTQVISLRRIYREIVAHIQSQPAGFQPLIDLDLFGDVPRGADAAGSSTRARNKICRHCAAEVFLYGLRDWFLRERQKGSVQEVKRIDCVDGVECSRQSDLAHAKEFNHLILPPSTNDRSTNETAAPPPITAATRLPYFPAFEDSSEDDEDDEQAFFSGTAGGMETDP
ncbi:unnamed protein product [Mycena citricolor]|uniref:Zn(2)-C6 fungal-type domain-containing protein n=1 Tax=Mycena citricolor TaxID=2018698 RepID=A0AAD2HZD3_9AGAR|nr:unnamed protein product [Mycena citricolor]